MSNSISDFSSFLNSIPITSSPPEKVKIKESKNLKSPEGRRLQEVFNQVAQPSTLRRCLFPAQNTPQNSDLKRPLLNAEEPSPKRRVIEMTSLNNSDPQTINFEELELKFNQPYIEKKVPEAPQKKRRPPRLEEQTSSFKTASESASKGTLTIQGQPAQVKLLSDRGSYMNVFTIEAPECILTEQSNDALVVKVFKGNRCTSSNRQLKSWMATSMHHYREVLKLKVPVATIYNSETSPLEGYLLQEKIAEPVDVQNPDHITQARQFFITFLQNKGLLFDLLPSNLMVTEKGIMKLIDFPEEFHEDWMDDSWLDLIKHALEQWCKLYKNATQAYAEQTLQFLNQFTHEFNLYGYDTTLNKGIVAGLFPNNSDKN